MVVGDVPSPSGSAMPSPMLWTGSAMPRFYMVVGVLF